MIGQTIAHYRITAELGSGGMGVVYRAEDLKLERTVALKFLSSEHVRDPEAKARFIHEARAASALDHPNICTIHGIEETADGRLFIAMACYEGQTLKQMLSHGPLAIPEAVSIGLQVSRGLARAHRLGIVHRDVKPANIFVCEDGLVKVLDFGIAKLAGVTQVTRTGSVLGTVHYMSPEQVRGEEVDRRTDVWSLGVVLHEMLAGRPAFRGESAQVVAYGIVHGEAGALPQATPAALIEAVGRCLQKEAGERYQSVEELLAALQLLDDGADAGVSRTLAPGRHTQSDARGARPYPGLASFTERDAEYFHGRESQVEAVWQKLRDRKLLAIVGPSGAGKTSFLRAGLLPAKPRNWGVIITTPGASPLLSLREALVRELSGDTEAIVALVREDDPDTDVATIRRWRRRHDEGLIILDQFEELFTLSPPAEQARFAELISRMIFEADARVVLSLRDDFFYRCHEHAGLAQALESVTALGPLDGPALRRALAQPAMDCGYAFEDETLVTEMMAQVQGERGALPLLAFAMARLWELRDRERGLLTRQAYAQIGEVGGALAQHAEAVLAEIGPERQGIVRELLRNLVTGQGTRSVLEREQLLSVFAASDRGAAAEVLDLLIGARLLTSYEAKGEDGLARHRVELVHESLLSAWPRLVRWRTQDADGAQLRDQLRQASQLWRERGESRDLLWTGTTYREYALWRERYPGGLTEAEESFGAAMGARARRDRRRRRLAVGGVIGMLLVMVGFFAWYGQAQRLASRRSEAGKLVLLGRAQLEEEPTYALAYALAAVELDDAPAHRYFALEALARGPAAWIVPLPDNFQLIGMGFSPDQSRMVVGGNGGVRVLPADGSPPLVVDDVMEFRSRSPVFTPDGEHLLMRIGKAMQPYHAPEGRAEIGLWSLQKQAFVREYLLEGITFPVRFGDRIDFVTLPPGEFVIRKWPGEGHEPVIHGRAHLDEAGTMNTDQGYTWHAIARGNVISVCRTDSLFDPSRDHRPVWTRARRLGEHAAEIRSIAFSDRDDGVDVLLATADASGEIRVWSPTAAPDAPLRVLQARAPVRGVALNRDATLLAARCGAEKTVTVWDLQGPRDALPRVLPHRGNRYFAPIRFDPTGQWLLAGFHDEIVFWPASRPERYVLDRILVPRFSADSRTVFGTKSSRHVIASRSLHDEPGRDLYEDKSGFVSGEPDPTGHMLAVIGGSELQLLHLDDGSTRPFADLRGSSEALAWSPDGKWIADAAIVKNSEIHLRLVNVDTGEFRILERGPYYFPALAFASDGSLLCAGNDGTIRRWDLDATTTTVVARGSLPAVSALSASRDGRQALAAFTPQAFRTPTSRSELRLCDLASGTSRVITTHGDNVVAVWLAPDGRSMAVRDFSGAIRIGPTTGEEPHLLVGPAGLGALAVSPDGRWLAADTNPWNTSTDTTTTLWPMPEGRPLHALPRGEFLAHLRAQTNVRVVADPEADSGYRVVTEPFPGLANLPRRQAEIRP